MSKQTTAWRTAAVLAALTVAPQLAGDVVHNDTISSWGISTAQAQPRYGTPEWDRNRDSRRANHYRDSDLARLNSITVRGQVTSNPNRDYFEFRSERGDNFRVLVRDGVSLRDIDRNDRVEIEGKRDGNILIAYRVRELDDDDRDDKDFRATVTDNLPGNRFSIRYRDRNRVVVAERGKPNGLRRGSEVELEGDWRGDTFYASKVRLKDNDWDDNWQDGQNRRLRGTATSDLRNDRFTLRIRNNQTVTVSTRGSSIRRISRGDDVEVWGRWDRGGNVFLATRADVDNDNDDDFREGRRVDFEGQVTKTDRIFNAWFYNVRTRRGRDVKVRYHREFRVGDRVEVEGVVQNKVVVASKMERD